jgi:hypothetical protein
MQLPRYRASSVAPPRRTGWDGARARFVIGQASRGDPCGRCVANERRCTNPEQCQVVCALVIAERARLHERPTRGGACALVLDCDHGPRRGALWHRAARDHLSQRPHDDRARRGPLVWSRTAHRPSNPTARRCNADLAGRADHSEVARTVDGAPAAAERSLANAAEAGIGLATATAELEREGVRSFCVSYHELLDCIEGKLGVIARYSSPPDARAPRAPTAGQRGRTSALQSVPMRRTAGGSHATSPAPVRRPADPRAAFAA